VQHGFSSSQIWCPHITIGYLHSDIHDVLKHTAFTGVNYNIHSKLVLNEKKNEKSIVSSSSVNNNTNKNNSSSSDYDDLRTSDVTILNTTTPATATDVSVADSLDVLRCLLHPLTKIVCKNATLHLPPPCNNHTETRAADDKTERCDNVMKSDSRSVLYYDYIDVSVLSVGGQSDDLSYLRHPDLVSLVPRGLVYLQKQQSRGLLSSISSSNTGPSTQQQVYFHPEPNPYVWEGGLRGLSKFTGKLQAIARHSFIPTAGVFFFLTII
jgi:hypothetical protein